MSTLENRLPLPRLRARTSLRAIPLPRPELAGLLVLAAVLNLWALDQNGWANDYYSAAVRSMASSWHNFLYGSFDPSGVMTVDKPPLALWVQALSVRTFGFNSLAILVPQALMGMASVALVYDLTRRRFGRVGGGVAGLVLALTPMTVAISRHNNPDALLVLCSVAALWFVVRALEDGRTKWLVWAGVCVGLGFEAKMAVALMVVPGIVAAWLWVAPRGRIAAVRQLLAGGAAMVVVGGAWPFLVALTPASDRPWISGTSDNSIWSLIFGYNGLGRLDGQAGGPQAFGGGGGGGGNFGGSAGPLRLLNDALGGQAGWLLGFALVGGVGILAASRLRRSDARTGWLIAVGGAFLVTAVAFSFAQGIFHPYYVSLLAPFAAALVGAAVAFIAGAGLVARIAAPLAVAAGVVVELVVLNNSPGQLAWLPAVLVIAGVLAVAALGWGVRARLRYAALGVALAALLVAPATWAAQTLGHPTSSTFPAGGPASASFDGGPGGPGGMRIGAHGGGFPGGPPRGLGAAGANRMPPPGTGFGGAGAGGVPGGPPPAAGAPGVPGANALPPPGAGFGAGRGGGPGGPGAFGGNSQALAKAIQYAKQHGGGTIGVSSQTAASGTIISSGADVAGLGGFSGRESAVSVSWLANAVKSGQIRWVLVENSGGPGQDGRVGSSKVMSTVAASCKKASGSLYDCQGSAAALSGSGS
jgi:4-amino-4-deoxy-L-arabinose transferase-like glycosyltransferase